MELATLPRVTVAPVGNYPPLRIEYLAHICLFTVANGNVDYGEFPWQFTAIANSENPWHFFFFSVGWVMLRKGYGGLYKAPT